MPIDTSEKNFETTIEQTLLATDFAPTPGKKAGEPGGYRKRQSDDYHRSFCLDRDEDRLIPWERDERESGFRVRMPKKKTSRAQMMTHYDA